MYCKECGKEIDNSSKFCSYCGTKQSINKVSGIKIDSNTKPEPNIQDVYTSQSFEEPQDKVKSEVFKIDKYDRTYNRDVYATIIGLVMGFTHSLILNSALQSYDKSPFLVFWTILVIYSLVAVLLVVNIAKRQNRNKYGWGIFALLLPYLALVIIGLLKKLNKLNFYNEIKLPRWVIIITIIVVISILINLLTQ